MASLINNKPQPNALTTKVAEKITAKKKHWIDRVSDILADREMDRLDKAIVVLYDGLSALEKELLKVNKADIINYGEEGNIIFEGRSKNRIEEVKKLREKIAKYHKVIENAEEQSHEVYELAKQHGGKDKGGSGAED